ncbi:hypothetical protein EON82_16735 [bacterium]|nr:MAG: hypothetical protein EON82_16735 [bacterium]
MPLRAPFLLAAFLSSALLFIVEPLAARLILPIFGGAPAVWNGTLLFFQASLLVGYLLAHLFATRLSPKAQRIVQPAFLIFSLLTIPLARDTAFQAWIRDRAAQGGAGVGLLLLALLALIGLPFVALSVNSPLLQRWYAGSGAKDADRPTFLYAAGNLGSLIALLAYPLVVEPNLTLGSQAATWRVGLLILALMVGACALLARPSAVPVTAVPETPKVAASTTQKLRWLALAAVPSALLMGCTTYITSNIAPIPLLWVVPLSLYLLTFVLVYAAKPIAPTVQLGRIYPMLVVPLAITILLAADKPLMGIFHLATFFVAAWMCHGILAKEAPSAEGLTEYWLYVSLGGALGGVFVSIVAPVLFNTLAEYPLALVAAAMLRPPIPRERAAAPGSLLHRWDTATMDLGYPLAVAAIAVILTLLLQSMLPAGMIRTFVLMGIPSALAFAAIDRPVRFGLALGAAFLIPSLFHVASVGDILLTERSFFGVHRVMREGAVNVDVFEPGRNRRPHKVKFGPFNDLLHGNTVHGKQDLSHPHEALTYYYKTGPIGGIMSNIHPDRVALVGLGVGSLAAYGLPGQRFDYFEIDPVVTRIAQDPKYFTFLRDSKAEVKVILGDARLTLSRAEPGYGLIVLDAFSSDSIPIHLLTVESFRMVLSKLAPGGIIAVHISNRYLNLEPVLVETARALGLVAQAFTDGTMTDEAAAGKTQSHWVAMARSQTEIAPLRDIDKTWDDIERQPGVRPWTDDYSNVLGAFSPDQ